MPAEAHPEKRRDEDGRLRIPVLPPTELSEALRKAREVFRFSRKVRGEAMTHDLRILEKAIDLLVSEVIG